MAEKEEPKGDAASKLDAIMDAMTRLHGRMDSYEAEAKERKDAAEMAEKKRSMFDAARKDKFGKRHDGEKYDAWKKRHDADEAAMCDAMRKDGASDEEAMSDARRARHDAEEAEKRADAESFEKWAKEETEEPSHKGDGAKKDAGPTDKGAEAKEEPEKVKEAENFKHDASAKIAGLEAQLAQMNAMLRGMTAETPASERDALASAQARHDGVAARFGDRAPSPIPGETSLAYRRRLASRLQKHSPRFKDTSLSALDAAALGVVEDVIYADAVAASTATPQSAPGMLIERVTREGGRDVTRYEGDPMAWMQHFMTVGNVGRFRQPAQRGMM